MPEREDSAKHLHVGGRRFRLPPSRAARVAIGIGLVIAGLFGWLPVLGFWMIPLGFLVLSYDVPLVARWRQRTEDWWARRRKPRE